jgi:alkanesulfonate monooxygenase SsuD/methylene tetrahydromethanopterin reductase-like flavin-dependent oxidoreductase (luciferase family)
MAHTLDEISGGRLILGVGAGWHKPEFDAFGFPYNRRVDRLEEALQILSPLLKGTSVDFTGTYYQVENCQITPLGPRKEGIPLLIGAFGPRMLRLTARYGDMWNTAWHGEPHDISEPLANLRNACAEEGREIATLGVTASVSVAFPDLGKINPFAQRPLSGSVEQLAQAFQRFADAGVAHLIIQPTPIGRPALERVAKATRLFRRAV